MPTSHLGGTLNDGEAVDKRSLRALRGNGLGLAGLGRQHEGAEHRTDEDADSPDVRSCRPPGAGGRRQGDSPSDGLSNAVDEYPEAGTRFVKLFVAAARAVGGFRPADDNYAGAGAIDRLREVFDREGWILESDGQLRPKVLDSLEGWELTDALRTLVRRARRGADDAELLIGTSKNLEEAVARHVLQGVSGGYSPSMDFVSTLYMAFDRLELATPRTTEKLDEDPYRELVLAIYYVGRAVNRLSNDRGDGHGRLTPPVATALEAQMTSLGAALVSELLLTAFDSR